VTLNRFKGCLDQDRYSSGPKRPGLFHLYL